MVRFKASTENLYPNFTWVLPPPPPQGGGTKSTRVAVREFLRANGIFISWAIPKRNSIPKPSNFTKKVLQLSALKGQGQDSSTALGFLPWLPRTLHALGQTYVGLQLTREHHAACEEKPPGPRVEGYCQTKLMALLNSWFLWSLHM